MNAQEERFVRMVADRRRMLGLTLNQVQEAGGPSHVTTGKIERGELAAPSARTLRRLDVSLRWAEGSAARALSGGEPVPLEGVPSARAGHHALAADEDSVTLSLAVVNELSEIAKRYERLAASVDNQDDAERIRAINTDLDLLVDRVLRAWLIAQLEATATPDNPLRANPLIEMLLGDYLNRAPEPPDPGDAHELQYLRWLTGRAPDDIDPATEKAFIAQWQARQEKNA